MPVLHVNLFWCDDADPRQTRAILTYCLQLAQSVGFQLEALPHNHRDPFFVLPYSGVVLSETEKIGKSTSQQNDIVDARVGKLCNAPASASRLNVIFGTLGSMPVLGGGMLIALGRTVFADNNEPPRPYLPYCVIDPDKAANMEPWTMLHEMGHAALAYAGVESRLHHNHSDPHDLMHQGSKEPVTMSADLVKAYRSAFFCSQA